MGGGNGVGVGVFYWKRGGGVSAVTNLAFPLDVGYWEEKDETDEPLDVIRSGISSSAQGGRAALMSSVRREGVDGESEVVN